MSNLTVATSTVASVSVEDAAKAKVLTAAAKLIEAGAKVSTRMDERETSNGVTKYFQFTCSLEEISKLSSDMLDGLLIEVTVAAYQGSYTGKEALAASQASNAANAFAAFGGRR